MSSLLNWGRNPLIVSRVIPADADTLALLVSDPASQWRVVDGLDPRLHAHAHVERVRGNELVAVRVAFGQRDVLWITWLLTPSPGTTEVDLVAQIEADKLPTRLLMLLGGRQRLRRHLENLLGTLADLAHGVAENVHESEPEIELPRHPLAIADRTTPTESHTGA